jgi:hypothetical protein
MSELAKVTTRVDSRFRNSIEKSYETRSAPSVAGTEELKRGAECKCTD